MCILICIICILQLIPSSHFTNSRSIGPKNDDEEEDREQERLAKRFAKRARMNRLLEMHGEEKEFTQSRLLDEDEDLKKELTKIRVRNVFSYYYYHVSQSSTNLFQTCTLL